MWKQTGPCLLGISGRYEKPKHLPVSPQQFSIRKERLLYVPLTLEGKYLLSIKYLVRHNLLVSICYHFLLSLACGRKDFYLHHVVHSVKCFFYNNLDDDMIA